MCVDPEGPEGVVEVEDDEFGERRGEEAWDGGGWWVLVVGEVVEVEVCRGAFCEFWHCGE